MPVTVLLKHLLLSFSGILIVSFSTVVAAAETAQIKINYVVGDFEIEEIVTQDTVTFSKFDLGKNLGFKDKPVWFRMIWKLTDFFRVIISRMPFTLKKTICYIIAIVVYYPLSRLSKYLEKAGFDVSNIPLSAYKHQPFYTLATDALDRFGTKLEQRFTKPEIIKMMLDANFENIKFNDPNPGWICLGYKKKS